MLLALHDELVQLLDFILEAFDGVVLRFDRFFMLEYLAVAVIQSLLELFDGLRQQS